ncbi:hypothetical protein ACFW04_014669 [Cataglyphis niger]
MDQFSKLVKLYPLKNQKLDSIMSALQTKYFEEIGIPYEILTNNGVKKTSPYNPQSNPVERVMRELGRLIRVYAHEKQRRWNRIIERAKKTINSTTHRSTGFRPIDLHPGIDGEIFIDSRLKSYGKEDQMDEETMERKIQMAAETLKRVCQRKVQTNKHREAERYEPGTKVYIG